MRCSELYPAHISEHRLLRGTTTRLPAIGKALKFSLKVLEFNVIAVAAPPHDSRGPYRESAKPNNEERYGNPPELDRGYAELRPKRGLTPNGLVEPADGQQQKENTSSQRSSGLGSL